MERRIMIEPRNLVVVNTFDEFAEKTAEMDYEKEDLVGLVVNLSNVFYWINIESLWGPLGFTWRAQNADKQGYGVFNTTTIPFSIIPSVPDGYRVTKLSNFLDYVSAPEIRVKKSNWENLKVVHRLAPADKTVYIDLTGAPITTIGEFNTPEGGYACLVGGNGKLYVKGDFSNASLPWDGGISQYGASEGTLIGDDNNIGVNLPINNRWSNNRWNCTFLWKGESPQKLENMFNMSQSQNFKARGQVKMFSENGKYDIIWIDGFTDDNKPLVISSTRTINNGYTDWNEAQILAETPTELTVRGTNIPLRYLLYTYPANQNRSYRRNVNHTWWDWTNRIQPYVYNFKPIVYDENIETVDAYMPFLLWEGEGYQNLDTVPLSKLTNYDSVITGFGTNGNLTLPRVDIFPAIYAHNATAKPAPIDCTNLTSINLMESIGGEFGINLCKFYTGSSLVTASSKAELPEGIKATAIDFIPELQNKPEKFDMFMFNFDASGSYTYVIPNIYYPEDESKDTKGMMGYLMPKNIKADVVAASQTFFETGSKWEFTAWRIIGGAPGHMVIQDGSVPVFKIVPNDTYKMCFWPRRGDTLAVTHYIGHAHEEGGSPYVNVIEFGGDFSDTNFQEKLKESYISTLVETHYIRYQDTNSVTGGIEFIKQKHPLVLTNAHEAHSNSYVSVGHRIDTQVGFIYKTNVRVISSNGNHSITIGDRATIHNIIGMIQPSAEANSDSYKLVLQRDPSSQTGPDVIKGERSWVTNEEMAYLKSCGYTIEDEEFYSN